MRILIGPSSFGRTDSAPIDLLRNAGLTVVPNPYGRKLTQAEVKTLLPGCIGLIAGLECIDRDVLCSSDLRVVSRCGSGISNVDLDAAEALGVAVYRTPEGPTQAVAEMTLGMMLCLMRKAMEMNADLHRGRWNKQTGAQLKGKTILIVGFGQIGQRVAVLLKPFDVRTLVCDPAVTTADSEYETVDLLDGISRADIISLHASGERLLLGPGELDQVKRGAFILNAARGSLIDASALLPHLNSGTISGCWLDTFAEEPYRGPLCGLKNVILTPHVGSYTREGRLNMEMEATNNLLKGLDRL